MSQVNAIDFVPSVMTAGRLPSRLTDARYGALDVYDRKYNMVIV